MAHTTKGDRTMQGARLGFDIAKQSLQMHGVGAHGPWRLSTVRIAVCLAVPHFSSSRTVVRS